MNGMEAPFTQTSRLIYGYVPNPAAFLFPKMPNMALNRSALRTRWGATRLKTQVGFVLLLLLAFCCRISSARPTSLLVRGGGSSPYEFNPNYVPHPNHKPVTLADLENVQFETQRYEPTQNTRSGVVDRIQKFAREIHASSPTLSLVSILCMMNFVAWQIPSCQGLLGRHFVCNRLNVKQGRLLSMLLSAISHAAPMHLLVNLYVYLNFGPKVLRTLQTTRWPLWPLALGSAVSGSAFYLLRNAWGGCMGLSGVTLAFMAFLAKAYPAHELVMVLVVFPVRLRAEILLRFSLLWSVLGSISTKGSVAHAAHLGGLLFGIGYYQLWTSRHWLRGALHRVGNRKPKR